MCEKGGEDLHGHLQDEVIKEALASGLDLREYSRKVKEDFKSFVPT